MKTEAEARETRCCGPADCGKYVFIPDPRPQDPMAETHGERFRVCIASECMAWRWGQKKAEPDDRWRDSLVGYCGLAGKC